MALRTDLNARQDDLAVARQLFYMTSSAIAAAVSSMVELRVLKSEVVIGLRLKGVLASDECRGMTLAAATRSPHCSDRFSCASFDPLLVRLPLKGFRARRHARPADVLIGEIRVWSR